MLHDFQERLRLDTEEASQHRVEPRVGLRIKQRFNPGSNQKPILNKAGPGRYLLREAVAARPRNAVRVMNRFMPQGIAMKVLAVHAA